MWRLSYMGEQHDFGPVNVAGVEFDGAYFRTDDAPRPRQDGITFGEDFTDPGDVTLDVSLTVGLGDVPGAALSVLRQQSHAFKVAWDAAVLRGAAGEVAELICGEFGMFEGRPRNMTWDWQNYASGHLTGRAVFVRANHTVYETGAGGDVPWESVTLGLVPAQVGGLVAPLVAPLRTSVESTRAAPIHVDGGVANPVYELRGPIQSNAQIEVPGRWRLYLNRGLNDFQTARIDTRPGRAATFLNNQPAQLLDPRSSLLAECTLLPGDNVVALRGASIEGTAQVTVRWLRTKAGTQ